VPAFGDSNYFSASGASGLGAGWSILENDAPRNVFTEP
jgi:hypothetical protein